MFLILFVPSANCKCLEWHRSPGIYVVFLHGVEWEEADLQLG